MSQGSSDNAIKNKMNYIKTENNQVYWEEKGASGIVESISSIPKTNTYQVSIYSSLIKKGDAYSSWQGWSTYPDKDYNQTTWCNVYARDLSKAIYDTDNTINDLPVPYGSQGLDANDLYDFFIAHSSGNNKIYKDVSDKNEEEIWDLIEMGYPVYFSMKSTTGHIETGIPKNTYCNGHKDRFENDISTQYFNSSSNNICVGAGSKTGYKSFTEYKSIFFNDAKTFLYLGFLKKEFNN